MGFNTQTFRGRATLEPASTPVIYNVTSPVTANTEFSQVLSDGTKKITVRVRGKANMQIAFTNGQSGTNFITVPSFASFNEETLSLTGITLYLQVDKPSQVIEILEWT